MMLELHNVIITPCIANLSLTVSDGQLVFLTGKPGCGKTTLLKAVLGLIPIDSGHISIDGELLTPKSALYFRRQMAYVPQLLEVPDGFDEVPTDYLDLLRRAIESGRGLLIVDEPPQKLSDQEQQAVDRLLSDACKQGTTILAVGTRGDIGGIGQQDSFNAITTVSL